MTTTSEVVKVKALLVRLRDTPINSADGSDDVLAPVFTYLMKVLPNSSDKCYHWFCSRADQVTVGAATFLLRLFAYSSPKVDEWRARLIACLTGCCPCVKAFGEVKLTSRSTYFGAFSDDILRGFHKSFNDWELEFVKGGLASAGVSVAARNDSSALRAVPPGIIYHSVSNIRVLRDPDILRVMRSRPTVSSWPTDVPPPGLIILMFDESQAVRQWAKAFVAACSEIPMAEDHFVTGHEVALQTIFNLIAKTANQHDPAGLHAPLMEGETFPVGSFSFTSDPNEIWAGFCQVLRHIPPTTILRSYGGTDCRRVVTSHLHDTGPQFAHILKCMLFLLKRLTADLWNGEAPEFPQVVFDAIKDNPSYIKLVEEVQVVHLDEKPWFLSWFGEYLLSLKDSGVFGDVLAKTVDLLCEELQHERFKEVRPVVMFAAIRLLSSLTKSGSPARSAVRDLVTAGLARDVREIAGAINQSCVFLAGQTDTFSTCTVREHMWKKTYESLQTNDADGAICLLDLVAHQPSCAMFLVVQRLLGTVMILMLSPIDDIQTAAKTLVGQAFDVDVRLDCFRALLSNLPNPSLSAIVGFLEKFIRHAPQVTEACSLSKSLVQCLTDIIEVLCSSPNGLLHSDAFLQPQDSQGPASQLPQLWMLMTQSITVIFKRTPLWADFFDIPDMTVWMRDALIFGRDMLAQWRVIESAAVKATEEDFTLTQKPSKLSRIGKRMMNDLQPVLPELARWLRLSDEELLHQSFALIQTVLECFRTTGVPPSEAGLAKLNKHVDDARKTTHGTPRTRLDSARIAKLEDTLAAFESDDDDVEIISVTTASSRTSASARKDAKPVRKEVQTILKPPAPQKPAKASLVDQSKLERPAFPTFKRTRETVTSGPSRPLPGHNEVPKVWPPSPNFKGPLMRRNPLKDDRSKCLMSQTGPRTQRWNDFIEGTMHVGEPCGSNLIFLDFIRAILSWNYDHHGPDPPTQGTLLRVPDKFVDHHQYLSVFEPLLLLECWAQIVQSKEGTQPSYDCKICSKQFTDDFIDLEVTISEALQKDWRLLETDVVLLRHPSGKTSLLAKTQSYFTNQNGTQVTLRCFIPNGADLGLQINSVWSLKKVFSLATLHREYGALVALPFYDAFQCIMQPRISAMPHLDNHDIDQTMSTHRVNEPQARAILGSLRAEGFGLIQGPPGTGKTSTICGLVEAFLSRRPRATTSIHAGRNSTQADKGPVKKILLCAPSNAAIDEVASRLKEGYRGTQKRGEPIKVVRIGSEKAIDIGARDVALDYLVEQKMNGENMRDSNDAGKQQIAQLRQEIESVKRAKQQKLEELSTVQNNTARTLAIEEDIKKLNSRRMALTQQFDRLKDKQKSDHRTLDAVRRRFRIEVLQEADVICTTLAGSGHDSVEQLEFEMVIIDEAAQAVELTSLIPLKFRTPKCIMVGDPQQLPPTVLSQEACKFNYNQSLFVRLQKHRPEAVHLLSIQYRMHPEISQLPSRLFYQGRLLDGPDMGVKTRQPWQSHAKFGCYRFFNVLRGREESAIGHSMKNVLEAQVAVALYARLRKEFASVDFDFRIGIVSMYRGQVVEMQRTFERRFGEDIRGKIHFNTVDGFQGQEKDIIILSCVRAGPGVQSVGFLADVRRMNVALTRAKSSLFILGNTATLERSDADWKEIVNNARTRSLLTDADASYFTEPTHVQSARPASPTKASKQRPVPKPPEPVDLVTPQSMAESVRAKPQSQNASSSPIVPTSVQTAPGSSGNLVQHPLPKKPSIGEASSSMKHLLPKRPFVEDASSSIREDRPKPPAHKRHKKDKGSIFIPKKPKP
ncbi:putative senataxin [Boletus reticuloceps]|uniref:Putative senataxin n=1 Tax=Boletus reticuloceps TaxID=495285 RepID=A0A8I3AC66_9AGAM|nr:putative senataxin [Boletus reticuloceps]